MSLSLFNRAVVRAALLFLFLALDFSTAAASERIVFVDDALRDHQTLIGALPGDAEVVVLRHQGDGLAQIACHLEGRSNLQSIHVFSEGRRGAVQLGRVWLNATTLYDHAEDLRRAGFALAPGGDILLYGCNVAEGKEGGEFLAAFGALTQADVAASTNLTGAAQVGGNWILESRVGTIEASTVLDAQQAAGYSHVMNTLNAGDLAVIGWNALTDTVSLVTLVSIPSGTVIKITDKGWDRATDVFTPSSTTDGIVTWTTSSTIAAGTVLSLFLGGSDATTTLTNITTSTVLMGDIVVSTYTFPDPMGIAGDQIFIYQDADTNPYFIFGLNNSSGPVDVTNWNTSIGADLRDSMLPDGTGSQNALTNGANAIGLPGGGSQQDNVQYTGDTAGADRATWLARIANSSNWSGDNDGMITTSVGTTLGSSITVSAPNAAPVVTASGGTTAFTEGNNVASTPVVIDSNNTIMDTDNATLASGTVSITGNFQTTQDTLAFTNNPATMGNISGNYTIGTGILALSSAGATATVAQWQAALRSVTYTNSSNSPNTSTRTVSFVVNDGAANSSAGTKAVSVASTNDTPIATASGGTTAFTEGNNVASTPVVIDGVVTVSDLDSATLASATVSITANLQTGEDVLAFTNDSATMGNISGNYTAGTGVLALSSSGATATVAQWQAALQVVIYTNLSDTPNTMSRTIGFAVNDGSTSSPLATKTVSVTGANDSPTDISLSASTVNQSGGVNATVGTFSSVDADSVTFTYSLVSGAGSTNNASFNISGSTLRANDASALASGSYSVRIRTTDNASATLDEIFVITVIDNGAPAAPSTPDLAPASDSGSSSTDDVTNVATPTFTGTAEANSTVELFRGGVTSLGTTTADSSGNWSLTIGTPLIGATYSITATATDLGANTSVASPALSITIDTTAPVAPALVGITSDTGTSSTDQITSDPTLILSGTAEANSVVTLTLVGVGAIGTATATGAGNWSFDYTATTLSAGDHVFRAIATDTAGNTSTASTDFLVTVDAASPAQVTISSISTDSGSSATDGITNDQTLTFSGTADAGTTVTLNRTGIGALGTAVANGLRIWTFNYTGTTLPAGDYLFTASSADLAGNISVVSASFPVTVDFTAPIAPSITTITNDTGSSATDLITSDGTLILSGTAEASAVVTVTRTGTGVIGTATADGAGAWTFDYTAITLAIGSHLFTATATDLAGNAGPASASFNVTVQAAPTISTQPVGGTYQVGDTITLTVVPSGVGPFTYQWHLDGVALTDTGIRSGSTSASLTQTGVTASGFAGTYTVVVTNLSGSVTSANAVVVINKLPQTITFAQPAAPTAGTPLTLSAAASSGLLVTFSVVSGAATIVSGNQLVASQGGAITIRASQAGDATYDVAADVDRNVIATVAAPQITLQPVGGVVAEGGTFTLTTGATGVGISFQWTFNGTAIPGANQSTLVLTGAAQSQQGSYAVIVTNDTGSVTSTAVNVTVQIDNRLFNLSSRLRAGTGSKTFISGFVISGSAAKSVVIRGVGPGLTQFGLSSVLGHPTLQLFSGGTKIAEAAEWGKASNLVELTATMQRLGMFTLNTLDSAMLVSLQPGNYTAMITGANGETGVSLVEIYDASIATSRLINISTRGEVGRGADVLIAGFIIAGTTPKKLLIRAVGPGLTVYGVEGVLVNPALRLFNQAGVTLADNDNWEDTDGGAGVSAFTAVTGAFPLVRGTTDAAMAVTLPPGAYTAHGYGKDDGTGVALVEVYEVP